MTIRQVLLLSMALLMTMHLCGCGGARGPKELKDSPSLHKKFSISKNYQAVYRGINDKLMECDILNANKDSALYQDSQSGTIHIRNVGPFGGSLLYIEFKAVDDKTTTVDVYSHYSMSSWQRYVEAIRMGANGENGCPR